MRLAVDFAIALMFAIAASTATYVYLEARPAEHRPAGDPPEVLGAVVGRTTFDEVVAAAHRAGLRCEDASIAAIMRRAHAAHGVDPAAARGKPPANHAAMLADPLLRQVRYACDGARPDLSGSDGAGRLLFVHDHRASPLGLVAYQRHHADPAAAAEELAATVRRFEARYGAPRHGRGSAELQALVPFEREWQVAGTIVRVRALSFGARGASVGYELTLPAAAPGPGTAYHAART